MHRKRKLSTGGNVSTMAHEDSEAPAQPPNQPIEHQCRIILPRDYVAPDTSQYEKAAKEMLQEALIAITASSTGAIQGRERLFRTVQNLCVLKQGQETYSQMREHYQKHCKEELQALHETIDRDQIEAVHVVWTTHCRQMKTIISIFMYLDRVILKPGAIATMGKEIFRNELMSGAAFPRMICALMDRFREEREGIDHMDESSSLVRDIVDMTCELNLYEVIETEFLKETKEFYEQEGIAMCSAPDMNVANYLEHVRSRLEQETSRVQAYLQAHTLPHTISSVEQKLTLIQNGFSALMSALPSTLSSLALFFQLASRAKGQDRIKLALHDYVMHCSMEILKGDTVTIGEGDVIDRVGQFKDNIDTVVHQAGEMTVDLQHSCKDAFEAVFKSRGNLPAELLSKHINWLLRGSMKIHEHELEARLSRCMVIFKFVHGKDMFEAFYKAALAQRLLLNESCSQAAEINMISKLRTECGALFTTKLEGMFKDIELSQEIVAQYPGLPSEPFEFCPTVLTTSHWPQSLNQPQSLPLIIPQPILQYQSDFERFYVARHSGRKLSWVYHVSNAIIAGHFPQGKKELIVSPYQALVLLAFNDAPDILSYTALKDRTGLPDDQLKHALGSFCKEKLRVLKKRKKGPVVDIDEFQVNRSFSHPSRRISAFARPIEAKTETEEVTAQVMSDRMYQIDAILVRHMKAVKSCSQTELIRYSLDQCGFPVPVEDIHKRISSLVDREYIERDDKNQNAFRYVA